MKQIISKIVYSLLIIVLLLHNAFADTTNIDGGGGGMGTGTSDNVWKVATDGGGVAYDAEGLRVYLVNSITGVPTSTAIDITNYSVAKSNVWNGQGKTKYEYKHISSALNFTPSYSYKKIDTSPQKLPQIIPWDESSSTARINSIKNWFLDKNYANWVLSKLGTNIESVRSGGYLLAIEPIAYFKYNGYYYAMTATEAALYNQMKGGDLRNKMGPLTHKNLPLSIFLEKDEFTSSTYRINKWTGSRTSNAADTDIINQLGIGFIHYSPNEEDEPEEIEGGSTLSYPTDTWVVTSYRLCNVKPYGGSWTSGSPITSKYYATAHIAVRGTNYTISNIYVPSGGEQLVWVKWKTPSSPQTLTMTASTDKGYYYNENNVNVYDRYANYMTTNIKIYDRNEEKPPPDPTLSHSPSTYSYTAAASNSYKSTRLSSSKTTNNWTVWDCDFIPYQTYTKTYSKRNSMPSYPSGNSYNAETGIYTVYTTLRTYSQTYSSKYYSYTIYYVDVRFQEYIYKYDSIKYKAEIKNTAVKLTPNSHCPTDYTSGGTTYMKSGYGTDIEMETYIKITIENPKTGTSTNTYYSADTTTYAACPQTILTYFPEFGYKKYNRMLEKESGKYVFKKNVYSTYKDRTHYTPWWYPDGQKYSVVAKSNYAYTPAGRLYEFAESTGIMIDGNLYDDWRQSPVRG